MFVRTLAIVNLYVILAFASGGAYAGFAGNNAKGDFGLQLRLQPYSQFHNIHQTLFIPYHRLLS